MKKAKKYIYVVLAAMLLNFMLWKIGGDCLGVKVNSKSNLSVLFTLVWLGMIGLLLTGIIRWIWRYVNFIPKTNRSKIILAISLVLLIFGSDTFYNFKNLGSKILYNKQRKVLCDKIMDAEYMANGTKAENLTLKEYKQIRNLIPLPSISSESFDISYLYSYDGFLPDYRIEVIYKLPKTVKVKSYEEGEYDFGDGRFVEEFDDYNQITYSEYNR